MLQNEGNNASIVQLRKFATMGSASRARRRGAPGHRSTNERGSPLSLLWVLITPQLSPEEFIWVTAAGEPNGRGDASWCTAAAAGADVTTSIHNLTHLGAFHTIARFKYSWQHWESISRVERRDATYNLHKNVENNRWGCAKTHSAPEMRRMVSSVAAAHETHAAN